MQYDIFFKMRYWKDDGKKRTGNVKINRPVCQSFNFNSLSLHPPLQLLYFLTMGEQNNIFLPLLYFTDDKMSFVIGDRDERYRYIVTLCSHTKILVWKAAYK